MPTRLNRTQIAAIAAVFVVLVGIGVAFALTSREAPVARATPSAEPTPTPSPTPEPTPTPSPTPEPTPTPTPFDQALIDSRLTVLVLGLDSNRTRAGLNQETNTDAMVVASVNADHTQIATLSFPRDTVDLPMADGTFWTGKLNALTRFLGIEALRDTIETTLGIEIDYYVQVDMDDFTKLVNAVGGVDVEVPYPLCDAKLGGWCVGAGVQHLDGAGAQYYTRTRVDGDYARQGRQQQVLLALVRKLGDPATEIDPIALVESLPSVQTDIPLEKLPTLMEIGRLSADAEISSQVLGPPRFALFEGVEGPARGWVMIPNVPEMRAYAQAVMGGE